MIQTLYGHREKLLASAKPGSPHQVPAPQQASKPDLKFEDMQSNQQERAS